MIEGKKFNDRTCRKIGLLELADTMFEYEDVLAMFSWDVLYDVLWRVYTRCSNLCTSQMI